MRFYFFKEKYLKKKSGKKPSLKIKEGLIRLFFWTDNRKFYGQLMKANVE